MGLFDELERAAGSLLQGQGGMAQSPIARSLLGLLGQGGGLSGLVQALQQGGLGEIVGSWVGTGQNLPISAQQVQQALGGRVQQLAVQHGLSPDVVSQALSQLLPGMVDHLTPGGQLPAGGAVGEGIDSLRAKLGL
jgi:uncharacterized protein YidB (DUF937 family)